MRDESRKALEVRTVAPMSDVARRTAAVQHSSLPPKKRRTPKHGRSQRPNPS